MELIRDVIYFAVSRTLFFIFCSIFFIIFIVAHHFVIFYIDNTDKLEIQIKNISSNLSTGILSNSYIKSKGESCQKASNLGQDIDKQMQEIVKQTNTGLYSLALYFSWNSPIEKLQNSITQFNDAALNCNKLLIENLTKLRPSLIADIEKLKEESEKARESIDIYTVDSKKLDVALETHLKSEQPTFYNFSAKHEWQNKKNQLQETLKEKQDVLRLLKINEYSRQQQIKNIEESLKNTNFQPLPTTQNLIASIPTFNKIREIYLSNLYWLIFFVLLGDSINKLFWYFIMAKIAERCSKPTKILREDEIL